MNNAAKKREHMIQERMRMLHVRGLSRRLAVELNRVAVEASALGPIDPVITAHEIRLERLLAVDYSRIFIDFSGRVAAMIGAKAKPQTYDAAVVRFTRKWSARKADDISKTTRKKIEAIIANAAIEDLGEVETGKRILEEVGGEMGSARAETIARTETHAASQDASFEMAQQAGVNLTKEWVAVADARTRETHVEANGQEVEMHERFEVGDDELLYPGDPSGMPEEVINCRCVCIYNPKR